MRTYSNKVYCRQFAISQTTTSCSSRTECHARQSPHCRLPAFQCVWVHWTRKLAAEQSRSKSRGLFNVDSVVADGVSSQNFRHWSAEASSDRLLGWANTGIERFISCQKDWRWLSRQRVVMLTFVSTNHIVRDHPCFTVFRMKIEQDSCVIVKFNAILPVLTIYAN